MAKVLIEPGVCGLKTQLEITSDDGMAVIIKGSSMCESIQEIIDCLEELDGYETVFSRFGQSPLAKLFNERARHGSCPALSGFIKGIEVCLGLALPGDVIIKIEK